MNIKAACEALALRRATLYRHNKPPLPKAPPDALSVEEQQKVLEALHSERVSGQTPRQIYATLLDEGLSLCALRTMDRLLAQKHAVRERRHPRRHPLYNKPELRASGANQLWRWDLTKRLGPAQWTYYYLSVRPAGGLQPLRGRLAGSPERVGYPRRATHCRELRPSGHRAGSVDGPC